MELCLAARRALPVTDGRGGHGGSELVGGAYHGREPGEVANCGHLLHAVRTGTGTGTGIGTGSATTRPCWLQPSTNGYDEQGRLLAVDIQGRPV